MKEARQIGEALPKKEQLFPGIEQIEKDDLIGEETTLLDCMFLPSTQPGKNKEFAVVLADHHGKQITYAVGGACAEKLRKLKDIDAFPVIAVLMKPTSKATGFKYYDYR